MNTSHEIYARRINKVIDYVSDHLDRSIPLEELAGVACFSPYHFHRIFVAVTGGSVNGYTNRIRLEKVARVLRVFKKSIATISYECGFFSPATLSRSFKNHFW
ncbi:MAG: helix-turn-helix domain-containing protein, partial [Flavobacteriaceae bacterium]